MRGFAATLYANLTSTCGRNFVICLTITFRLAKNVILSRCNMLYYKLPENSSVIENGRIDRTVMKDVGYTSIRISLATRDLLVSIGSKDQTYDDIVNGLAKDRLSK